MRLHRLSQEKLGEALEVTQGAVGHWLNERRPITLREFFKLCEAAGASPKLILFGDSSQDEALAAIGQILESHPELNPNYRPFERRVKKSLPKGRKTRKTAKTPS